MSVRLYYSDAYVQSFTASVVELSADGRIAVLDQTAFYPASGGQPFDTGTLNGIAVEEVSEDEGHIRHLLAAPLSAGPVTGEIDFVRRFDHMQQHTGQHLFSAVLAESHCLETVSFHLGREWCTIDVAAPAVSEEVLQAAAEQANREIVQNRPVRVTFEDAATASGLRKPTGRSGEIRVVTIEGLDRSACGGTHVRATGEIGALITRGTEKVRQTTRLEFACGQRALRLLAAERIAARTQIAQGHERVAELEKERRKMAGELAGYRGRELYAQSPAAAAGWRMAVRTVPALDDTVRAEATAFVGSGPGAYLAQAGPAVLLAVAANPGLDAGKLLKPFLSKGGGSASMAQGTLAAPGETQAVIEAIERQLAAANSR